jgi:hypothetical protein
MVVAPWCSPMCFPNRPSTYRGASDLSLRSDAQICQADLLRWVTLLHKQPLLRERGDEAGLPAAATPATSTPLPTLPQLTR